MSRELYDLCRRYKHYYKKVNDVKSLNDKYHDLDLSSAFNVSQWQLCETEDMMLKQLFKEFDVMCSNIETETEFQEPYYSTSRCLGNPRIVGSNSTVSIHNSGRFLKILQNYMCDLKKEWWNK